MSKPKIIILEGPDCAGKSTLAKVIAKKLGCALIHSSYDKSIQKGVEFYLLNMGDNAIANAESQGVCVLDRHWLSEKIYSEVFQRGGGAYTYPRFVIEQFEPIYIFCLHDNLESAIARHKAEIDEDHPYEDEDFKEICRKYEEAFFTETLKKPGRVFGKRVGEYEPTEESLSKFLTSINLI